MPPQDQNPQQPNGGAQGQVPTEQAQPTVPAPAPAVPQTPEAAQPSNSDSTPAASSPGLQPTPNDAAPQPLAAQPTDAQGIPARGGLRILLYVLSFLFFLPSFVVVIIFAKRYDADRAQGDAAAAQKHWRTMVIWTIVGCVIGGLLLWARLAAPK